MMKEQLRIKNFIDYLGTELKEIHMNKRILKMRDCRKIKESIKEKSPWKMDILILGSGSTVDLMDMVPLLKMTAISIKGTTGKGSNKVMENTNIQMVRFTKETFGEMKDVGLEHSNLPMEIYTKDTGLKTRDIIKVRPSVLMVRLTLACTRWVN